MLNLEDYNYPLQKELIAQTAFHPRDQCRLLVLKGNKIEHKTFSDIIDYLNPGDVLVINETKVRHCKISGKKETGGKVVATIVKNLNHNLYETRIKGRNLKVGTKLIFKHHQAKIVKTDDDIFYLKFNKPLKESDLELLTPPYIRRKVPEKDYQTVFARIPGSLAAPTAGLHFTPKLLRHIGQKGVKIARIQLDISFETFLPVRNIETHKTGKEYFVVDKKNAKIINSGKRIIAVGTTVVKCLESGDWKKGKIIPKEGISEIFIKLGHRFKTPISAMVTNFHLPKSSLLLLTSAYAGRERLLKAYREAVKQRYRLFSLGDAMVILK